MMASPFLKKVKPLFPHCFLNSRLGTQDNTAEDFGISDGSSKSASPLESFPLPVTRYTASTGVRHIQNQFQLRFGRT